MHINGEVSLAGSNIQQPVDIQGRYAQTVQTHNAVNVGATNGTSDSVWIDSNGFDSVAITLLNDAATNSNVDIHWSNDGVNFHGYESLLGVATTRQRAVLTTIKARYFRVRLGNTDASAHTMSAWAYLKA